MNILITSAASDLAQGLASTLSGEHQIRLTDLVDVETDLEFVRCDLGHDEGNQQTCSGDRRHCAYSAAAAFCSCRIQPARKLGDRLPDTLHLQSFDGSG